MDVRLKIAATLVLTTGLAGMGCAAHAQPVTLTGGWVADFSRAMMETPQKSTTVFQFEGSYKMLIPSTEDVYFLVSCVGMEAATKVNDKETLTHGNGRCELTDRQGDKLLSGMETAFDGFTLKIDGGTGKWESATGTVVSKETFTFESERQLKGYSNAKGDIQLKK